MPERFFGPLAIPYLFLNPGLQSLVQVAELLLGPFDRCNIIDHPDVPESGRIGVADILAAPGYPAMLSGISTNDGNFGIRRVAELRTRPRIDERRRAEENETINGGGWEHGRRVQAEQPAELLRDRDRAVAF